MRRYLLEKLIAWKNNPGRKPLILQGARQTGKTTLLHQFGNDYFQNVHSFNFEEDPRLAEIFEKNLDPSHIVNELRFYLTKDIDITKDLIIFDEIQACPRALTSLKYFQEKMPQVALCAAGSLLGIYLGPVSFPVGKVDMLTLYPMSFEEFLLAQGDHRSLEVLNQCSLGNYDIPHFAHEHLWQELKYYFIVGGLPEVVLQFINQKENLFTAFQEVRQKQKVLLRAYLADIAKHSGPVNSMHISRIFESVPQQLAKSQDGTSSRYIFKGVVPGIDRYSKLVGALDWLMKAGLLIKVPVVNSGHLPFSAYAQENIFKLYLFDIGLLGAMSQMNPKVILEYDFGSYKGYFAENFVAQAFLAGGMEQLFSWQEKTAEVEFLSETDGCVIPIEVKSGWVKQAKSLKIFAEKYNCPYRVIFSASHPTIKENVRHYPLYLAERFPQKENTSM